MPLPARKLVETVLERIRGAALTGRRGFALEGLDDLSIGGKLHAKLRAGRTLRSYSREQGSTFKLVFDDGTTASLKLSPQQWTPEAADKVRQARRALSGGGPVSAGGQIGMRLDGADLHERLRDRIGRSVRQPFVDRPGLASAGALAGAGIGAQMIGAPLVEGVSRSIQQGAEGTDALESLLGAIVEHRDATRASQLRDERLAELQAMNMERLARVRPDLYHQLLANRRLPRGAVPIGGRQRQDLVEQAAMLMSEGAFGPPSQPQ